MKVSAKVDLPKVRFDKDSDVNLMLSLTAPDVESNQKRNPLAIVAVLDRSGSMGQQNKLVNLRKTMYKLIDNMTETDYLGLVFFDDQITFVDFARMDSTNKERFKKEIAHTEHRGSTDIGSALNKAAQMFTKFECPAGGVERVLLLTDGEANAGAIHPEHFVPIVNGLRKNIGLSTFGYGEQYNETLLAAISKQGKGANYFVDNLDSVAKAFATELGSLLTCYAQEITLSLVPHQGTKIVNVLNDFDVKSEEDDHGNLVTTIDVGDIFRNETKHILVRIAAGKRERALPREVTLADVTISYRELDNGKKEQAALKPKIEFVKDAAQATKEADKEIAERVALLEAALMHEKAKAMADAGDWKGAKQVLRTSWESLRNFDSPAAVAYSCSLEEDNNMIGADYSAQSFVSKKMSATSTLYRRGKGNAGSSASGQSAARVATASNVVMNNMVDNFTTTGGAGGGLSGVAGAGGGTAAPVEPAKPESKKKPAGYTKNRQSK